MKKIFQITLLAGLALSLHLFAGKNKGRPYFSAKKPQMEEMNSLEPGYQTDSNTMGHGYSYPGRISVTDEWDFYSYVSLLYWQMIPDGYDFMFYQNTQDHTSEWVRWPNKWKPALKVGLAMTFHRHDDWQMLGEYLRYYSTTHVSANKRGGDSPTMLLGLIGLAGGVSLERGEARLHIGLDAVNLSLSRPYYLGSKLIFDTFFGIHAAWIHQDMQANNWDITSFAPLQTVLTPFYLKSRDWSLGPRTGFDMKYLLGKGVRFFGKGAVSLNYRRQHFRGILYRFLDNLVAPDIINRARSNLRPELELGAGFAWGTYIDDYNWNFDLSLGYDMYMIFKEQNLFYDMAYRLEDSFKLMNLYLHGLTVSAKLDF